MILRRRCDPQISRICAEGFQEVLEIESAEIGEIWEWEN